MFGKLLAVALVSVLAWAALARSSSGADRPGTYTVRAGDTLWTIASAHSSGDVREEIWKLERRNHLAGGLIRPGQKLIVP
jgi:LysM repeat protein